MKKRVLSWLLCLVMVIGLLPQMSFAATTIVERGYYGSDLTYTLDSDGVLIFEGTGEVPPGIYYDRDDVTRVVIRDGVTKIGEQAFERCYNLKSVGIPDSVTTIEDWAFYGPSSFTICYGGSSDAWEEVIKGTGCISSSVTICYNSELGDDGVVYTANKDHAEVVDALSPSVDVVIASEALGLPVTAIAKKAFYGCSGLTSVEIPDSVTTIGDSAFYKCFGLTSVEIPDSVTSIGSYAFSDCDSLTSVHITDLAAWCAIEFSGSHASPLYYGEELYLNGELVTELVIPDGVPAIGNYAFCDCDSLTSVEIPDSVTTIAASAFAYCGSLTSVVIPDSVTSIGDSAFCCANLTTLCYGGSSEDWETATNGRRVVYDDTTTYYNSEVADNGVMYTAYEDHAEVVDALSPSGDVVITSEFRGLPVTAIAAEAFYGCSEMTSIVIPNSVTSIGADAFFNCGGLEEMTIPFIGASRSAGGAPDGVFGYLFGKSDTGEYVVANQYYSVLNFVEYNIPTSLKKVTVTDATKVPYGAFEGCLGIDYIALNEGVTQISQFAFANCDFLSVWMPKTVSRIGTDAFKWTDVEKLYVSHNSFCHEYAETNSYPHTFYDYFPVTGVTLDRTTLSLYEGKSASLTATVSPSNATYPGVTWSSSDPSVATVDANGAVTAIDKGSAVITATTEEGGFTATCAVTVLRPVRGVTLAYSELNLGVGYSKTLTATVTPADAYNKKVIWSSSDPSVATVTNGIITAVDYGSAVITATTEDGGYTAECVVNSTIPATGVTLNKNSAALLVGENVTLSATVTPSDAFDKSVRWSSSNESVATVKDGVVTAIGAGSAVITVTTNDGEKTASCVVTVTAPAVAVTGISLNKSTLALTAGGYETVVATVTPSNASNQAVTWSSSDTKIATVDGSGMVTAVANGVAIITAKTADGGYTATCTVTVTGGSTPAVAVTGVTVSRASASLTVGECVTLSATVTPSDAADQTVSWSSSNESVATVENGVVTAIGAGSAVITVTTNDGGYTATCIVTVLLPVVEPDPIIPSDSPTISVSEATGKSGGTVSVKVALANNPGIVSMRLEVDYDDTYLTLTEVTDAGVLGVKNHKGNVLSWENDTAEENIMTNGTVATLTFTVAEGAPEGEYPITVTYDNEDREDILNYDLEPVDFAIQSGGVEVKNYIVGDVNGDGKVTASDRITLSRYLADWPGYEDRVDLAAADVNNDGKVTASDRIILSRYLADWPGYDALPHVK